MQSKLPLEVRENIYAHLFDASHPRAVAHHETSENLFLAPSDIFHNEWIFDKKVMGETTSQEIQGQVLRTTPIYFRGRAKFFLNVQDLLDIKLSSGEEVKDLIRHLRVYLRVERFQDEKREILDANGILPMRNLFTEAQLELGMYKTYEARLHALTSLPFRSHSIKLEICVLYERLRYKEADEADRVEYNLVETARVALVRAERAGAVDVKVRLEDVGTGVKIDVREICSDVGGEVSKHAHCVPACYRQEMRERLIQHTTAKPRTTLRPPRHLACNHLPHLLSRT